MGERVQIVTVREVSALLRFTEATVCSLASSRKLPGFKKGKSWRFDMVKIEGLLAGNPRWEDRPAGDHKNTEEVQ